MPSSRLSRICAGRLAAGGAAGEEAGEELGEEVGEDSTESFLLVMVIACVRGRVDQLDEVAAG